MNPDDVKNFQRAVEVFAMAVNAYGRIQGMIAENQFRMHRGDALSYSDADFSAVLQDTGIENNSIIHRLYGD